MTVLEAVSARHSVRQYENRPIAPDAKLALNLEIERCNRESGLHIQLITDEPKAFEGFLPHYGKFSGVTNYLALVGPKSAKLDELCGYYGEHLVLLAQTLGLNSCWVALTFRKIPGTYIVDDGEKLCVVIALGYGKTQGVQHKSKDAAEIAEYSGEEPAWFTRGVEAALLAPTAVNQQQFEIKGDGSRVKIKAKRGFFNNVDLGIVKYHFEAGAGKENFEFV